MMNRNDRVFHPDRVLDYFRTEWFSLLLVTVSGLIYNIGLLAGPWFEGKMAECLLNILQGRAVFRTMLCLAVCYAAVTALVQTARYIKRFYVRRFANNVNRRMKKTLYASMIRMSRTQLEQEGTGSVITKAITDVDDCVEGMRKFTTEVFDTGVALAGYVVMLLVYDWRLGLLCLIFPPVSYITAEKMKQIVQKTGAAFKEQNAALSASVLDRASNAVTYRVFGCEERREQDYEKDLSAYEKAAVWSNVWVTALPPLYQIISMAGVIFILYFGARNVLHTGWAVWDIAAFTTFLSCFTRLSVKSSKAAKLFNSVQKAQVSWKRIRPFMENVPETLQVQVLSAEPVRAEHLGFVYPDGARIFSEISFQAFPGQIIAVTGPVACGKTTLGKAFLCEYPYEGSLRFGKQELQDMSQDSTRGVIGYLGHDPELLSDTVRQNILLGEEGDISEYLRAVCLDQEVSLMENGEDTLVGTGGVRLSGGQAQRLALARTYMNRRPVMILDDPFSALDRKTEEQIFVNLRRLQGDSIVILISHRLYLFPQMDQIIWMKDGKAVTGVHEELMRKVPEYALLYREQEGGMENEPAKEN